ncbi:MAG: Trp biosynthesis-associated membrane protein [Leifsonia flava]
MQKPKYKVILVIVVGAALALLAATQQWFTLTVASGAGGSTELAVSGAVAAPALSALAFAALALAAALAIAGPFIRIVLGVLGVLLGGSVILSTTLALGDPVAAGASVVTGATGVSGSDSVHELVSSVGGSAWPVLALVAGIVIALGAIGVLVTTRRWPASARKYQAVRLESTEVSAKDRAVDEWDELSRGDDPTAEPDAGPANR